MLNPVRGKKILLFSRIVCPVLLPDTKRSLCAVEVVTVVPVKFWVLDMPVWTSSIWLSVSRNEEWFTMLLTMLLMSGKLFGLPGGLPSSMLEVANTEVFQPRGLFGTAQVLCASSIYLYTLHFILEKA